MTIDQLVLQPEFYHALQTFNEIQKWGANPQNQKQRTGLMIREMLSGNPIWENFTDDGIPVSIDRLGKIHQDIGYLIAHNFPQFAALCTIPIYVAFDHADEQHNGIYRLTTYR